MIRYDVSTAVQHWWTFIGSLIFVQFVETAHCLNVSKILKIFYNLSNNVR